MFTPAQRAVDGRLSYRTATEGQLPTVTGYDETHRDLINKGPATHREATSMAFFAGAIPSEAGPPRERSVTRIT